MKPTVSELTVPVSWGDMRGKVWGPNHGRPVLCLHGWADNCGSFDTLIPLLPTECTYVALDLPGHGLSSHRPPGSFYSYLEFASDVRRLVEALQWRRFSIIGHSMGGIIASMFSALFPEMVEGLILLDTSGFYPADLDEVPRSIRQGIEDTLQFEKNTEERRQKVYTYEKAMQRLLSAVPSLSERSVQVLLERGQHQADGGVVFSRDFRVNFRNMLRFSLEQSLTMMSMIQASILVIIAEHSSAGSPSHSAPLKVLQGFQDRNHTVVTVAGDHHIHLNCPEVVAPFVSNFLRSKVLSQSTTQVTSKL
ncbi:serine hydrolase-like protein [Genypterus blacodes]|uniref:serine hydrolase-like protein n=1 Tax=Genypterus blacodes TaxID=154954 RepID=UPI003F77418F